MNERLKELIEECTDRHFSECVGGFETFDKEKFAELIVRECVGICMKNQFDGAENYNNGSVSSAEFIKEHFGVQDESQRYTPYDPKLGKSITTTGQAVLRKLIKQLGLK